MTSIDVPVAATEAADVTAAPGEARPAWLETALPAVLAAVAVVLVSLLAVVSSL